MYKYESMLARMLANIRFIFRRSLIDRSTLYVYFRKYFEFFVNVLTSYKHIISRNILIQSTHCLPGACFASARNKILNNQQQHIV